MPAWGLNTIRFSMVQSPTQMSLIKIPKCFKPGMIGPDSWGLEVFFCFLFQTWNPAAFIRDDTNGIIIFLPCVFLLLFYKYINTHILAFVTSPWLKKPIPIFPSGSSNRGEEVTRTVSFARCSPGAVWLNLLVGSLGSVKNPGLPGSPHGRWRVMKLIILFWTTSMVEKLNPFGKGSSEQWRVCFRRN